jgi:uncharacterized integral membrane protein (TIGR00698 family)
VTALSRLSNEALAVDRQNHRVALQQKSVGLWLAGILFTLIISALGFGLSKLPVLHPVGQLGCAILLAITYRQIWGYPEKLRTGIQFSSKKLLRLAIILYGLKLNMDVIFHQGLGLLAIDAGVIVFAIGLTMLLARWLKAESSLSLLLAAGTGICGAAAIAAVSPIIKAKDEDTAIGVGIIALVGTLFAIGYTIVRPFIPLSAEQYGVWSGISLHEIAHVALAAAPGGPDALAMGLLAKLGRVFLLIPVCLLLMWWMQRKAGARMAEGADGEAESAGGRIEFPWFLLGFIAMSVFGSYVLGTYIPAPETLMGGISNVTTFILAMAMTGLGLNVSLHDVRTKALRPLLAMSITSVLLTGIAYLVM